mmetsp:Transcript_62709/g.161953  ORF Transcript_62709/g.161953 Transcript_62709/m.161953 type:complete len:201 (+) Transcript_62709:791-1393(+)
MQAPLLRFQRFRRECRSCRSTPTCGQVATQTKRPRRNLLLTSSVQRTWVLRAIASIGTPTNAAAPRARVGIFSSRVGTRSRSRSRSRRLCHRRHAAMSSVAQRVQAHGAVPRTVFVSGLTYRAAASTPSDSFEVVLRKAACLAVPMGMGGFGFKVVLTQLSLLCRLMSRPPALWSLQIAILVGLALCCFFALPSTPIFRI